MKVIILASGKGARMLPLTEKVPKPMLVYKNKNLIEWKLESLPESIEEIIIVVGYLDHVIKDYFGNNWRNINIKYVQQEILNGTGGAVDLCKNLVNDKTLILMGDDIYKKEDLELLVKNENAILVFDLKEDGLKRKGQILRDQNNNLIGINEGLSQNNTSSSLINTGACVISKKYFDYEPVQFSETEYGLPHTLVKMAKNHAVKVVEASEWKQITKPDDLL